MFNDILMQFSHLPVFLCAHVGRPWTDAGVFCLLSSTLAFSACFLLTCGSTAIAKTFITGDNMRFQFDRTLDWLFILHRKTHDVFSLV